MISTKIAKDVKAGRLESILPMIAKKAIATYYKLPSSAKLGTSIQDLIAEGSHLAVLKASKQWKPGRNIKFTTYLFAALDNHYVSVLRAAYSGGRLAHVYSSDSSIVPTTPGKGVMLHDFIRKSRIDVIEDKLIARIDAERGFLRAYAMASPRLRQYLIRWLLQPNNNKFKDGERAQDVMKQFTTTARPYLTVILCETIQKDFRLRQTIADTLACKFWTPLPGWDIAHNFGGTVERELVPIISKALLEKVMRGMPMTSYKTACSRFQKVQNGKALSAA